MKLLWEHRAFFLHIIELWDFSSISPMVEKHWHQGTDLPQQGRVNLLWGWYGEICGGPE